MREFYLQQRKKRGASLEVTLGETSSALALGLWYFNKILDDFKNAVNKLGDVFYDQGFAQICANECCEKLGIVF
jgi:hypothetical protein